MPKGPPPGPTAVLRHHTAAVQALLYSPHDSLLYSGDAAGEVKLWDLQDLRPLWTRRLHSQSAGVIQLQLVSSAGAQQTLLSQGRDGTALCWGVLQDGSVTRDPLQIIDTGSYNFCKASTLTPASSNDEEALASSSNASVQHHCWIAVADEDPASIALWDLQARGRVVQLQQPADAPSRGMCMALKMLQPAGPQGPVFLLAGYEDGAVALWDIRQPLQPLAALRLHTEPVMCLELAPGGSIGAQMTAYSGSADDTLQSFSVDTGLGTLQLLQKTQLGAGTPGLADIRCRPDGRILATAGWDGRVRIFSQRRLQPLAILKHHTAGVSCVQFGNDRGMTLASASRDCTIALWTVYPPQEAELSSRATDVAGC